MTRAMDLRRLGEETHHRLRQRWNLVWQLTSREVQTRFLGSALGALWVFLTPLLMLAVYSFVFGFVFKAKWAGAYSGTGDFVLNMFGGLVVFAFFGDVVARAPRLVVDQPNLVKKVAFPLDSLTWVAIGSAGVTALVSMTIFVVSVAVVRQQLPVTLVLVPIYFAPLVLLLAGLGWLLSALGVYFRDLTQVTGVVVSAMLFLTPVFYPASAVPEGFRTILELNPLTFYVDALRSLTLQGELPDHRHFLGSWVGSIAVFVLGRAFFARARAGFADVL